MIIEAISNSFAEGVVRSATKAPKPPQANDAKVVKSTPKWSGSFVLKNLKMIYEMLNEVEAIVEKEGEIVRPKSPCALVTDISGKLTDVFDVERNMSQLLPFCFPVR